MTRYVQFAPSNDVPFKFTANIGGQNVFVTIPYNLYSNRYYVQIRNRSNEIMLYAPLIESPDGFDMNIALPFVPGSLIYRASTNNFEIN